MGRRNEVVAYHVRGASGTVMLVPMNQLQDVWRVLQLCHAGWSHAVATGGPFTKKLSSGGSENAEDELQSSRKTVGAPTGPVEWNDDV